MLAISQYIRSVTGAALIAAVILRLLEGKGSAAEIGKVLVGIFMALTVITPITKVELSSPERWLPELSADASAAVAEGEDYGKKALAESISSRVEAYILDKAAQMDVTLCVEAELSKDAIPVPQRVRLQGNISPYAKSKLQAIIQNDLGIDKENQLWT